MNPEENIPPVIEYNSLGHAPRGPHAREILIGTCIWIFGLAAFPIGLTIVSFGILVVCNFDDMFTSAMTTFHRVIMGIGIILCGWLLFLLSLKCFELAHKLFAQKPPEVTQPSRQEQ